MTPDALNLLEQFSLTVTVRGGHEIYGQSEPTEFCWRIVSGCVRTAKFLEDGRRQVGAFLWLAICSAWTIWARMISVLKQSRT